jgi:hypothetical protein
MSPLAPPPAPPPDLPLVDQDDRDRDDDRRRLRMRLTQLSVSAITVLATAWACTLGPIPAIIAIMTAKHILVAVYLMGLGMGDVYPKKHEAPAEEG